MRISFAVGSRVLSLPKLVRGLIKMSELHAKSRSRGTSLFWPAYMLSWAVLAGGALTYLSLNTIPPSLQGGALGTPPQSNQESNRAELDRAQLTAQVRSLNDTVASLRSDLARFKHTQQPVEDAAAAINRALSDAQPSEATLPSSSSITTSSVAKSEPTALPVSVPRGTTELRESTPPAATSKAAEVAPTNDQPVVQPEIMNAPAAAKPAAASSTTTVASSAAPVGEARPRRNLATSPLKPGRVPPLPFVKAPPPNKQSSAAVIENPYQPKQLNKTVSQIRTSSLPIPKNVSPPRIAAKAPTQPRPTTFGVPKITQRQAVSALSLSTAQSVTGLRASWLLLTSRHPETFGRFQPRYIADQANGTYRLLAGPISSHAEADRICTELRAQSVSCGVTTYIGSALQ